jgi:hypothetical protein
MAAVQYSSRLRFVDAAKIPEGDVKFDHLPIYGWGHEKLGNLDGFVVDAESDAVQYAVVKGGGWFNSKRFLLPIGHIDHFDQDKKELMTDISQDAIRLLPEFDKEKFLNMSDAELREFERATSAACCPNVVVVEEVVWIHDEGAHYRQPSWWRAEYAQTPASTVRTTRP